MYLLNNRNYITLISYMSNLNFFTKELQIILKQFTHYLSNISVLTLEGAVVC